MSVGVVSKVHHAYVPTRAWGYLDLASNLCFEAAEGTNHIVAHSLGAQASSLTLHILPHVARVSEFPPQDGSVGSVLVGLRIVLESRKASGLAPKEV